jgi:Chaperone of endosialidase
MAWQEVGGAIPTTTGSDVPTNQNNWLGTRNAAPLIIRTENLTAAPVAGTAVMNITPANPGGNIRPRSVGIGTDQVNPNLPVQPKAKLHVNSSDPYYPAIHASGSSASLSFASQTATDFIPDGQDGNRWVWEAYPDPHGSPISNARLWSRGDRLIITGSYGQMLLNTSDRNLLAVDYPQVPIGKLTDPVFGGLDPSPPVPSELILGGVRTSIRGFDGDPDNPASGDGRSLRLGHHWIRTNGNENELWMTFYRWQSIFGRVGRSLHAAVEWFGPRFEETSDERLKTNVRPVEGALQKLERIRGVEYESAESESPYALGGVPGQSGIGVVAQEVEQVFPELVSVYNAEHEYKAVHYGGLTSVLIEAVKDLKAQNEELRSRIEALEGV